MLHKALQLCKGYLSYNLLIFNRFLQNEVLKLPKSDRRDYHFVTSHFSKLCMTLTARKMSSDTINSTLLKPPEVVRCMTILDRDAFTKVISVPTVVVPLDFINVIRKKLKPFHLKMPRLKEIIDLEDDDPTSTTHKRVLLDPEKFISYSDLNKDIQNLLSEIGIVADNFTDHEIKLTYENWTCKEILQAVIPANVSGYAMIGHICHFNLKEEVLQYKHLIGEVVLDKMKAAKTVVNKTNTIDNTYRSFKMELMAGEENYVTQVRENGMVYELDFSKVYWNSRLGTEHQRIVDCISSGDTVYDVFAGVGPFAIPSAKKKKATVFANDLNPVSYEYLQKNVKLNTVKTGIQCYNMDGRDFIKTVLKDNLLKQWTSDEEQEHSKSDHIIMNLPALAVEFLDAFKNLINYIERLKIHKSVILPKVYCYCFTEHKNELDEKLALEKYFEQGVKDRVKNVVGDSVDADIRVRYVRNVAPNKEMMLASFTLTWDILCHQKYPDQETDEPAAKCRKLEESPAVNSENVT